MHNYELCMQLAYCKHFLSTLEYTVFMFRASMFAVLEIIFYHWQSWETNINIKQHTTHNTQTNVNVNNETTTTVLSEQRLGKTSLIANSREIASIRERKVKIATNAGWRKCNFGCTFGQCQMCVGLSFNRSSPRIHKKLCTSLHEHLWAICWLWLLAASCQRCV